jgi:signal transduction histidine kinase
VEQRQEPSAISHPRSRRYERLLWAGYCMMGASIVVLGVVAAVTLRETVNQKDELLFGEAEDVLHVQHLRSACELESRKLRTFLLNKDERVLGEVRRIEERVDRGFRLVRSRIASEEGYGLLRSVLELHELSRQTMARAVAMRRSGTPLDQVARFYEESVTQHREQMDVAFDALERHEERQFEAAKRVSVNSTERTTRRLLGAIAATALLAATTGVLLFMALRALRSQQLALDRYVKEIADANRDLDAFAGRIAHDLKNVIAPLPLIARRLREASDTSAKAAGERVERVALRSMAMLEALLAFARSGRPSDVSAASSVRAVVADVIEDLRPQAAVADAEVELDLEPLELGCSPGLLSIVLVNIVGNAFKFVQGRPVRRVTIRAQRQGQWCAVSVEDTGPGIPSAALSRIFEPFYRVPGSHATGTGIGLATVQRIVDAHAGRISVESEPDRGTTFRVWLPLASDTAPL